MLLDTGHRRTVADDSTAAGHSGLPATVVRPLVTSAHALGRRAWAHGETAFDAELAPDAGIDGLAHAPGYAVASAPDSTLARHRPSDALVRRIAAGARLVAGSDTYADDGTIVADAGARGEVAGVTLARNSPGLTLRPRPPQAGRRRRRAATPPNASSPVPSSAQVPGSGTAVTCSKTVWTLPSYTAGLTPVAAT